MAESEKITINMGVVDLGQVDLLVEQGFYSSRTDFIRSAIRRQLDTHGQEVKETVTRKAFTMGIVSYSRGELERLHAEGKMLDIRTLGLLHLASDIEPELARHTIQSVTVYGVFRASESVKAALADRTT
jgi:Arc/MetJ-type ribon-helix-helix transcriptional regulator